MVHQVLQLWEESYPRGFVHQHLAHNNAPKHGIALASASVAELTIRQCNRFKLLDSRIDSRGLHGELLDLLSLGLAGWRADESDLKSCGLLTVRGQILVNEIDIDMLCVAAAPWRP